MGGGGGGRVLLFFSLEIVNYTCFNDVPGVVFAIKVPSVVVDNATHFNLCIFTILCEIIFCHFSVCSTCYATLCILVYLHFFLVISLCLFHTLNM